MIRRPKRGEGEDDILQMQEEYLREKANQNFQPAAQVVNLRRSEPTKRANTSNTSDSNDRKPSKYAQSKGLKNHEKKRTRIDESSNSCLGNIYEKNMEDLPLASNPEIEDDNVYFPKVIPSILGNIVEKNVDTFLGGDSNPMPPEGFPVVTYRTSNILGSPVFEKSTKMDIDEPQPSSSIETDNIMIVDNLPNKSYVISSQYAEDIHKDNIKKLSQMSEKEILLEQQKLLTSLDPKLVEYLRAKREQASTSQIKVDMKPDQEKIEISQETKSEETESNMLWDNDILSHPQLNKWLHFDSLEKDKLEWMKVINESKALKPDEPYEARFDFKGYLLPYTMEYTEKTKTLFHHGEEPHRPGYSLSELIELSRSAVTQQRVMALNTIAGILEYNNVGTYKDILEIPLSKMFFVVRYAMDENKVIILEPALKAMRNLLFNKIDEASLDSLIGFEEGTHQPCLENDKSEIEELESKESDLKDFHLAEIDIIAALLRTNILQRLFYILDTVRPSFNCVQYSMQILTRIARDSVAASTAIVDSSHLMRSIINHFIPNTSINFYFEPQIVYNGKPILSALKLLRVMSLQCYEISNTLVTKYGILQPISQYISSAVNGTYGLRIQIETFSLLTNLLQYNVGIESATSLFPVIVTALYKHIRGTDIFTYSSMVSATHAAVILQFINVFLNYRHVDNMNKYKEQIYPLLKEGVQKWVTQLTYSENFTCGHLRILCSTLDCCKTVLVNENITMKFLNDLLKQLVNSKGFNKIIKHLVPSSNLLSDVENKDFHITKNLKSLGTSTIDRADKVLPILNIQSPIPLLASLFKILCFINDKHLTNTFVNSVNVYLETLATKMPNLCDNWFTRIETDFLFYVVKSSIQCDIPESNKDLLYALASKLCYILRIDKKYELDFLFKNIVFNKQWFTAQRLLNLVSFEDTAGFSKVLLSINDIESCYSHVINLNYKNTGPNIVFRTWQQPILPRDWIYLPILMLYSKNQDQEVKPSVVGNHALKVVAEEARQKALIVTCSLEWILFYETCFPDLLKDIDVTDRLCRIMCVFLCDSSLFLDKDIKVLLQESIKLLFKKNKPFDFDKPIMGLNNFQDFYTQFLEQFQSVSYGDPTFAACVLAPLAQKHNVKWRKLLWSEYAGCLRALDCPENMLCYDINEYLYPEETDESLIKSYFQALAGNLLRPNTISHRMAEHHVNMYKKRNKR